MSGVRTHVDLSEETPHHPFCPLPPDDDCLHLRLRRHWLGSGTATAAADLDLAPTPIPMPMPRGTRGTRIGRRCDRHQLTGNYGATSHVYYVKQHETRRDRDHLCIHKRQRRPLKRFISSHHIISRLHHATHNGQSPSLICSREQPADTLFSPSKPSL
jgi:hypothetical protein